MTKASDTIADKTSDEDLVRAHLEKHGVTKIKPGVRHDVSDRKWDAVVKSGKKVPISSVGGLTRDKPTPGITSSTKFAPPLKFSMGDRHHEAVPDDKVKHPAYDTTKFKDRRSETNPFKHDTKSYDTPVRYMKTGDKKGGAVKVIKGHRTFTKAALSDGDTPKKPFFSDPHPNQNRHPRFSINPSPEEKKGPYERRVGTEKNKSLLTLKTGRIKEEEAIDEKYMGFSKLKGSLSRKGVKDPGALAASIGRKKYGAKKFNSAAEKGKKMHEELSPEEMKKLSAINDSYDAEIEEAKKAGKKVPMAQTIVSSPLKGQNQDQSGVNTKNDVADYSISDEHAPRGDAINEIITAAHPVHAIGRIPGPLPAIGKDPGVTPKKIAPKGTTILQKEEELDVGAMVDRIKALPNQLPLTNNSDRDDLVRAWQRRKYTDD